MAVVHYKISEEGETKHMRSFHPPKRADLKYWWKAARKAMPILPFWEERFRSMISVDEQMITIDCGNWRVAIERKRHL